MPTSISTLRNQKLALLLWYLDPNQESRAVLVTGTLRCEGRAVTLERGDGVPPLPLPALMLRQVQPVPEELRELVAGAGYCMQLTLADIPWPRPEEDFHAWLPNYYRAG